MAQFGQGNVLGTISIAELGQISGPGGLIGAIVSGYRYFPLEDRVDLEQTITMIITDKINTVMNLPNRTMPNEIKNNSQSLDVYVGVLGDGTADVSLATSTIAYIPCHLITSIILMPLVEDAATIPSLDVVPNFQDLGDRIVDEVASPGNNVFSATKVFTLVYSNLVNIVRVYWASGNGAGFSGDTLWQMRKAGSATWIQPAIGGTQVLEYSPSELNAGNGFLDIEVRWEGGTNQVGNGNSFVFESNYTAEYLGDGTQADFTAIVNCIHQNP